MEKNRFYITTALDYTNDVIHIGHAYQKVLADVLARYHRKQGDKTFFLTGTDEYGSTNERAAAAAGKKPKEYVDEIAAEYKRQLDALNISYDRFIRTTDPDHIKTVRKFYLKIRENGDIYKGNYTGRYCVSCESYKTEREVVNGGCELHPTRKLEKVSEENYFFRWSKYETFLKAHLKNNPEFIQPESRRKEMLAFLDQGLKDLTISRQKERVGWGIPVPDDPDQVIYVWFDALINYISGAPHFWPADIHILGKDNVRWHTLLWPAMLKSAGYDLPTTIYAHGFLTLNGKKISKTLGNIIRPGELIKKYKGADPVRYYLLAKFSPAEGGDFSEKGLVETYNADLANGLGNLVSRVAKMAEGENLEKLKQYAATAKAPSLWEEVGWKLEKYDFPGALNLIWFNISALDRWITQKRPWDATGKARLKAMGKIIIAGEGLRGLLEIVEALEFFTPETAEKIKKQFSGGKIVPAPPLFPRLS